MRTIYYVPCCCQSPCYVNMPMVHHPFPPAFGAFPNEQMELNDHNGFPPFQYGNSIPLRDYGPAPFTVDINEAARQNDTFRTAIWTGENLQVTLMSIPVGEDIGLEIHPNDDQFLRIEQGQGVVQMGRHKNQLDYVRNVRDDSAIMVPAGTWHNLTNTGNVPLKLYSIYAPPHHPFGTVHATKEIAMAAEEGS